MSENKMKKSMNDELDSLYEAVFDGIKAPDELYRKVADMKSITKSKANMIQRAVIAALIAILVVCCSNFVVYAATGTGWIGRIVVSWSGEEYEVNFREETNSNGDTYYIGTVQNEKGDSFTTTTDDPAVLEGKSFEVDGTDVYVTSEDGEKKKIEVYDQEDGFTAAPVFVTPLPKK